MLLLVLFLACLFIALGAGFFASVSDLRGLTIPNSHSLIIAGSFVAAYALLWFAKHEGMFFSFGSHVLGGLLIFGITAALFAMNVIGAGDSKLASAYALWMSMHGLIAFVFYTSLAGGMLGLTAIVLRKLKPVKAPKPGTWIARLQGGDNKVPYGIAIAVGALASFVKLGYFDTEALRSFLL